MTPLAQALARLPVDPQTKCIVTSSDAAEIMRGIADLKDALAEAERERDFTTATLTEVVNRHADTEAELVAVRQERDRYIAAHDGPDGAYERAEALARENEKLREALERIEHFSYDVMLDAERDLQVMKEIARAALAGGGEQVGV